MRFKPVNSKTVRLTSHLFLSISWKIRKSWSSVMLFLGRFPLKNPAYQFSVKKRVAFQKTMITTKITVVARLWCLKTDCRTCRLVNLSSRNRSQLSSAKKLCEWPQRSAKTSSTMRSGITPCASNSNYRLTSWILSISSSHWRSNLRSKSASTPKRNTSDW